MGAVIDLTDNSLPNLQLVDPDFGNNGWVANANTQPAGTGVFKPFLTLQSPGSDLVESGYNSQDPLYLDQLRNHWNTYLKVGDLAKMTISGIDYYVFELDANEPNNANKKTISIDNIRIYTSATDTTGLVQNNEGNLDSLGVKRWALNDPLFISQNPDVYDIDPYILLDASQGQANGGSGVSDLRLYVPVSSFAGALATDYLWFYNLNGVHASADDAGAEAGFEEWRAYTNPTPTTNQTVPDGGATALLLGLGLFGVGMAARSRQLKKA